MTARQKGCTTRARSGAHHFVASEQLAIQFVLRNLAPGYAYNTDWEQPVWCNFIWFTDIRSSQIEVARTLSTQFGDVQVVKREITFLLANDPVVIISMEGDQYVPTESLPDPSIAWGIAQVSYLTAWDTGHEGQWVGRSMYLDSVTGLPTALAPIG